MYVLFKAIACIPPGLRKVLEKVGGVLLFPPSTFDNFYTNLPKMGPRTIRHCTQIDKNCDWDHFQFHVAPSSPPTKRNPRSDWKRVVVE